MIRRIVIAALLAAPLAHAAVPPDFTLVPVATGLDHPGPIANAGDHSNRLFVAELPGRVRVIKNGSLLVPPLIDITSIVDTCCGTEGGLLGLAFDPHFSSNGYVYTLHTDSARNDVVLRHHVAAGSDVADAARQTVITIGSGSGQHNGGDLKFGPDGYLYISVGDAAGGGAPAQQLNSLRGKILRIDVATLPYTIPPTNPYANDAPSANTRDEIFHVGLRNPWRMSFDRATGDLWIGDVGGDGGAYEELNRAPAGNGGLNFGWNCYSGTTPLSCTLPSFTAPEFSVQTFVLGCAVIGGYRFNGPVAMLRGTYIYGDYCSGEISAATRGATTWSSQLALTNDNPITAFGEDEAGWLYVSEYAMPGRVLKLHSDRIFATKME